MPDPSPSTVHRIRLQGPWEWAVPSPVSTHAWTWNRIRLPDEWDRLPAMPVAVWFRRRFNCPTGITADDLIRVVITSAISPGSVILNGRELSGLPTLNTDEQTVCRYDLRAVLSERNLLEIVFAQGITPPDVDGGMGRPVVLEIETAPGKCDAD